MNTKYQNSEYVDTFFKLLNENGVNYVLIKNINNELPYQLAIGKDIDILVDEKDKTKFNLLMRRIARKYIHPWGADNGWHNLYDLPDFEFWRLYQKEDLFIDVTYRLCCKSLMPNMWIPLDNLIQEYLWKNKEYDGENKWWILDINTRFVYYIVRCVFDKKCFNTNYKNEIRRTKPIIDKKVTTKMFRLIFFSFTPHLLSMIDNDELDDIRQAFLSYREY